MITSLVSGVPVGSGIRAFCPHGGQDQDMTRYAIDAPAAIRLVREDLTVAAGHQLVAPSVLRSQALSLLYRQTRRGEMTGAEARTLLDGITTMKIRLLGDRVSRATAWKVAEQLNWDDTVTAEYVAVAQLQADAFVTLDPDLARRVEKVVTLAPFEALTRP
jgi:predicted nucleic acid-binding protein